MGVFTGQMTFAVVEIYEQANICIFNALPNMTESYQSVDLTVNGYGKGK